MSARISLLLIFLLVGWGCSPLPRGIYHTVAKGQTLYSVSRAYGVDIKYLARLNGIDDPSRLRVGQRLFIPGADRQQDIPVTIAPHPSSLQDTGGALADVQRPPPAQAGAIRQQPAVKDSVPGPKMVSKDPAVESKANAAESRKGLFIWPARGKVVRTFGRHDHQTCNGLEIAIPAGTAVVSAADGQVIYSGDAIRGYGHLIIVRHDGDLFTVYGFNQKRLIESGKPVRQGERIAISGIPPAGGPPRLHFEIRHGKSPVNPIFYLP